MKQIVVVGLVGLSVTVWEEDCDEMDEDALAARVRAGPPPGALMANYLGTLPGAISTANVDDVIGPWQPAIGVGPVWRVLDGLGLAGGVTLDRADELRISNADATPDEALFCERFAALSTLMDMARSDGGMSADIGGRVKDAFQLFAGLWDIRKVE